jgi:sulfur relay protein TusB/DsrH
MLIILSKSPWAENYGSILEIARKAAENGEKVAVLHIQDACIAATINEYCEKLAENKIDIYALKADCEARGLVGKVNEKVRIIDYKQWVKLVMIEHKKIVSWTT